MWFKKGTCTPNIPACKV